MWRSVGGTNAGVDIGVFEVGGGFLYTMTDAITGICVYSSWFHGNVNPMAAFEVYGAPATDEQLDVHPAPALCKAL